VAGAHDDAVVRGCCACLCGEGTTDALLLGVSYVFPVHTSRIFLVHRSENATLYLALKRLYAREYAPCPLCLPRFA